MMHVCMCLKHPRLFILSSNAGLPLSTCTADQDQTATDVQMKTRLRLSVSERDFADAVAHCANVPLAEAFGWNFKEGFLEIETHGFAVPSEGILIKTLVSLTRWTVCSICCKQKEKKNHKSIVSTV